VHGPLQVAARGGDIAALMEQAAREPEPEQAPAAVLVEEQGAASLEGVLPRPPFQESN
jgi:hypothetical protein